MNKIWHCKIGEATPDAVPQGADNPMRKAVAKAYREITGQDADFIFSGWGGELTEPERAVVENRLPSEDHYKQWHEARAMNEELIVQIARDIAEALGDNFNYAFASKAEWIAQRGDTPGGFRDVNQPYEPDYIDAAIAAIAAMQPHIAAEREDAARRALEAAAADVEEWFPCGKIDEPKHAAGRAMRNSIRAIDPAQFREAGNG